MIKNLHHTNLVVSNIEKTKEFYTKILGLKIVLEESLEKGEFNRGVGLSETRVLLVMFSVPGSSTLLEAFQYLHPKGHPIPDNFKANDIGFGHICFEVTNIQNTYQKLLKRGVEFASPPVTMPSGVRWCYFYGPDREFLELLELPA